MPELSIGKIPVDPNGRTVIPIKVRKQLGLKPQDFFDVSMDTQLNQVVLRRAGDRCLLCACPEHLVKYKHLTLCKSCLQGFEPED